MFAIRSTLRLVMGEVMKGFEWISGGEVQAAS
jgi:hypothetical protein